MISTRRCRDLAFAIVIAAGGAASADPAGDALQRGLAKFEAKDYAGAIAEFEAGYAIDPNPELLYAQAQAQRLNNDCRAAIASYRAYLASNPPDVKAEKARKNIAKCETPTPKRVEPPPIVVKRPPPAPKRWWQDRTNMALGAGGVILLAAGGLFTLSARGHADEASQSGDLDAWIAANDAWSRDRVIAGVSLGIGASLITATIVRIATSSDRADKRVAVIPAPGGGMVALGGRW